METHRTLHTVEGVTLHYRVQRTESGEPNFIVLLHGMASNLTRWSEFTEQTTLRQHWNIVRPDLRGHGESFTRGRLNLEIWCRDLLNLLNAEKISRAVLVGHSLGAQVAVHFAASYPDRVQGLVLIDPIFRQALRGKMKWMAIFRPVVAMITPLLLFLNRIGLHRRFIPNRDLRKLDESARAWWNDPHQRHEMIELYSSPWEDLKFFPAVSFLQELLEVLRPLPAPEQWPVPLLALLSKGVTYTDPGMTRDWLEKHPHAEIETVDAYHWPLTEKPTDVRNTIERWCERFRN